MERRSSNIQFVQCVHPMKNDDWFPIVMIAAICILALLVIMFIAYFWPAAHTVNFVGVTK